MIERVTVAGYIEENAYLYIDDATGHGFLIDPGAEPDRITAAIRAGGWTIEKILLTHGHFDHIGAASEMRERLGVPVVAGERADEYLLDPAVNLSAGFGTDIVVRGAERIADGATVTLSGAPESALVALYTPGHTTDGVTYYSRRDGAAFVGDTIFKASIGNYTFPGGDYETIVASIQNRIFTLPPETLLYSGHTEETTVGAEMHRYGLD